MLKKLKEQGITILVSTPYMDEANRCDRIALIQKGRILSIDTPSQIVQAYPGKLYAVKGDSLHKVLLDIRQYSETLSCYAFGEYLHVAFRNSSAHPAGTEVQKGTSVRGEPGDPPSALKAWLEQKGHAAVVIKEIEATIEDCFIRLMTNEQGNPDNQANRPAPNPRSASPVSDQTSNPKP
jgi:ABC-2 type transport system ATP-binding protein